MSNILVTGANGFVGNHLIAELTANNHRVIAVGGHVGTASYGEDVRQLTLDLMKPGEVSQIDFTGVDAIVHLAGLAAVGPSFDSPLLYVATNIGIQVNLLEAALKQSATPRFLVVSSGSLYDPKADLPLSEDSVISPSSPYAVSKLGQEQMAQYYGGRGFEIMVARPFNHIGPGQNPGFLVPDLAQQIVACEKGDTDTISVGNLDAKRDYTDVRDIAKAYRLLIESGKAGEIYNICSGTSLSGHDILQALLEQASVRPTIEQDPARMRPSDAPDIYGSHEKISVDTGWQPSITLETTMQDVLADWRSR